MSFRLDVDPPPVAPHHHRERVDGWVLDLAEDRRAAEEHQRDVRRCLALLLRDLGWTQKKVADLLGISQQGVATLTNNGDSAVASEVVLRNAVAVAPADFLKKFRGK